MDGVLSRYHNRLSDDQIELQNPKKNLEKLKGIELEQFSTGNYPGLDDTIVMPTLTRSENKFRHLDLSNLVVSTCIKVIFIVK